MHFSLDDYHLTLPKCLLLWNYGVGNFNEYWMRITAVKNEITYSRGEHL